MDLFGTLQQIGTAHAKLSNILADNAGEWCDDAKWGARVKFYLLPDMASIVIGKKGATVQRIIKESNAGVRVSNEADQNNLQSCQVRGGSCYCAASGHALSSAMPIFNLQPTQTHLAPLRIHKSLLATLDKPAGSRSGVL